MHKKHRANRDALMKALKSLKKNESTFQSLHFRNTQNTWKDTQYYEVRHILCNIWMWVKLVPSTRIGGGGKC